MFSAIAPTLELSKYELIEEIGHGGMATVFRARDRRLGREVALKLLHRHLRESTEIEARFESEARAVAKLRHPNIVEVFDVSDADEPERYLVAELIRGETLRDLLRRGGALPVELAAEIVLELCEALEHAHQQGVIHRDVKPENVLVESVAEGARSSVDDLSRARVKLTDFGIAKLLDAQGVTSTGQVLGSPAHMAPEQIEGKVVDVRADVFSLGVLFYECLVGKLPFAGNNPAQVLRNVLEGNFAPPERIEPQIGARWSALVSKALQTNPSRRYQTVLELGTEIRAELTRLEFEHPRQDITCFLRDPEAYRGGFADQIVAALVRDARRARAARQVPLATNQFSRALAYKPGDADLLRMVSGLRRRFRLRRAAWGFAGAASVVGCIAAAAVFWPPAAAEVRPLASARPVVAASAEFAPVLVATTSNSQTPQGLAPTPRKARRLVPKRRPHETPPDEVAKRPVSVRVTGAVGGSVRIDGRDQPWFGVIHELTLGEHVFDFVPPDDTCCQPTRRTVEIVEGTGPQLVVGRIPFEDAGLQVSAEPTLGWQMSCPSLFQGVLALPGERSVPMSQISVSGSCTFSNPKEGSAPSQKVLTLRAGNTTVLTWP